LPEYASEKIGNWIVPLSMKRVSRQENKEIVGKQLGDLLTDKDLPFGEHPPQHPSPMVNPLAGVKAKNSTQEAANR
jgi:hypothetical protein